jgi:hypothetical protein
MTPATEPTIDPRQPPFICAFDQTSHESLDALHAHIRRFKVSRERYYHTYHPHTDPVNGKLIPFKDLDQYLEQSFESKITLKQWLKRNPAEGFAWSKQWLARRKADKGLTYAPSQAELRTLCCPSMPYYNSIGAAEGGYYGITRALGYADRYNAAPLSFTSLAADVVVVQDTREQTPIKLAATMIEATVTEGDYMLAPPHDLGVRIERKSLADLCGTLSDRRVARKGGRRGTGAIEDSSFQRFDRELARAQAAGFYVVMVVESDISSAQAFNKLPQTRWIKASPSHIMHNLRALLAKYPLTFQCVFADGRIEMARVMLRVFQLGTQVHTVDLQYKLETGEL